MQKRRNNSFAVIGLGTFGTTVASELARFGNHVLGIDTIERNVSRVAETLAEAVITGLRHSCTRGCRHAVGDADIERLRRAPSGTGM